LLAFIEKALFREEDGRTRKRLVKQALKRASVLFLARPYYYEVAFFWPIL
jgi:hypothetical protein